jgi:hypothetical protein
MIAVAESMNEFMIAVADSSELVRDEFMKLLAKREGQGYARSALWPVVQEIDRKGANAGKTQQQRFSAQVLDKLVETLGLLPPALTQFWWLLETTLMVRRDATVAERLALLRRYYLDAFIASALSNPRSIDTTLQLTHEPTKTLVPIVEQLREWSKLDSPDARVNEQFRNLFAHVTEVRGEASLVNFDPSERDHTYPALVKAVGQFEKPREFLCLHEAVDSLVTRRCANVQSLGFASFMRRAALRRPQGSSPQDVVVDVGALDPLGSIGDMPMEISVPSVLSPPSGRRHGRGHEHERGHQRHRHGGGEGGDDEFVAGEAEG